MTLPADLFPRRFVGSVAGLVGFGGAMGGVAFNYIAAGARHATKQPTSSPTATRSSSPMSSSFHILAFLLILATVRRVEPLEA